MSVLFDIGHPAHVHLFKNFIKYLTGKGIKVVTTSRDKEITNMLLEHYGIEYVSLSAPRKGLFNMFLELLVRDYEILKLHRKHQFTYAFGTSVSIAHLSAITQVKSYNFNEDDDDVVALYTNITYPFCTKIINPDCLRYNKWRERRVLYPSYHELAYLHPNNFKADESVLQKYGLEKGKYVIFRLVALAAHHDIGAKGISAALKAKMQAELSGYHIVESFEGKAGNKVDPWDMHHLLAFAKMIISDSQTMTIEAAVLGIPAIRINTFIGKSTVIDELEQKYLLAYGFFPHQEQTILDTLKSLLANTSLEQDWKQKQQTFLNDKVDFNNWMIQYFEQEIKTSV